MPTPIKYIHSGMSGAPVLSGTAGAMAAVLDAAMVNGLGLKAVTSIVISGGIATATVAAPHAFEPFVCALVAGASPPSLNGEKVVTATSSTTVSWATAEADGTATGSISIKVAPLGWAIAHTGTNLRAYKPSAPEASGCVLRIDDTGTTNARVRAYESMTDISTGLAPAPLDGQVAGGLYWPKSGAASTAARPWALVGDERGFYLAVSPQGTDRYTLLYAGDVASLKSGDAYGFLVTGNESDQVASTTVPTGCCGYSGRSARNGAYLSRAHTAIGQSVAAQRLGAHHNGGTADAYAGTAGYSVGTYPNGPNNGLMTGSLELHALGIRGTLPGLLHPVQDCGGAFATGAIVAGTDDLAGRRLIAIRTAPPAGGVVPGAVFIDETGPWER